MTDAAVDASFDLEAYLRRVGYRGVRAPSSDVLDALCAAHPAAIPFENIDPLLGRVPSLRIGDVQAKLVGAQRGGYCFEHNALLRQALLAFGFSVRSLAARVTWMAPPGLPPRPCTHMLLMVELDSQRRLVDAGFGGHLINVALKLDPGLEQATPHSRLRVTVADGVYTLETRLTEAADGWSPIYRFTLAPQLPVDCEPLNWYTATQPTSIFRHNLLMERLTPALRANLLNDKLTLRAPGEAPRVQRLADAPAFERALTEFFDVWLPVPARELFDRVPRGRDGIVLP